VFKQEAKLRIFKLAAVGGVLVGLLSIGSTALAASTPAGGPIVGFVSNPGGASSPILITGAIGDHGTSTSIDKNGKKDPNGDYVKVVLKKGGFEVNAVKFNKVLNNLKPQVNRATCSAWAVGTGPVTLFNGTGLYKGIRGQLTATATFAFIGPIVKGKCDMSNSAKPVAQYSSIEVTGGVKF
jgi:hypothetical protein